MDILSAENVTSPVMALAVELAASHSPFSCAAAVIQQASTDAAIAQSH